MRSKPGVERGLIHRGWSRAAYRSQGTWLRRCCQCRRGGARPRTPLRILSRDGDRLCAEHVCRHQVAAPATTVASYGL